MYHSRANTIETENQNLARCVEWKILYQSNNSQHLVVLKIVKAASALNPNRMDVDGGGGRWQINDKDKQFGQAISESWNLLSIWGWHREQKLSTAPDDGAPTS